MRHAWMAGLALLGLGPAGGEDERGVVLYEQGQYAEAAAAFRAAIETDGPSAERAYNLALALWKAGDLDEAETAAEQAATLSDGDLNPLRDGLLGNLRYAAAEAVQEEDLQAALSLAKQARAHFLRAALAPGARPEVARNLERALVLIDELEKKIEEQEKQEQENKDDKSDEKSDDQKKQDPKNQDEKNQDQKQDEQNNEDPEEPPEPEPEEPKPEDQEQNEQKKEPQPQPAPGEQPEGRELTPEEKKRLLDKLEELDKQRLALRMRQKAARPKVEKDW